MSERAALTVLLVEDNPDHAALAKGAILKASRRGYQVELAQSVEEAIEKLANISVSMVISDFNLPGKNGLELLTWLNERKIEVPFIMMTGMGDEKTAVKAMQAGAYNYLVKDDNYLDVLPHVIEETFFQHLADKERERFELEIRQKNVELEKANRELKKLDQLKADFIASVSHDLRTPLNSVQESIALIIDGIVNVKEEKGQNVLGICKRNVQRLKVMIDDLLDFSKLEAGKMRLHIELYDVQILVDEVMASLKPIADKRKVTLSFSPLKEFPKIPCDPERIVQILTNLVTNAVKFTPEGGMVAVRLVPAQGGKIQIVVQDTGVGIKQEDIGRIFERFEQVKGTSPKDMKGTGLGLSICKELVKLHQGDIWAESDPGKGSRFIVALPVTQGFPREAVQRMEGQIPAA